MQEKGSKYEDGTFSLDVSKAGEILVHVGKDGFDERDATINYIKGKPKPSKNRVTQESNDEKINTVVKKDPLAQAYNPLLVDLNKEKERLKAQSELK